MKFSSLSIVVTTFSLVFGIANGQECLYPPYSDSCNSIPNFSLAGTCNCLDASYQGLIEAFVTGLQPSADATLPESCFEEQYLQYISDYIQGAQGFGLIGRECPTFPSFPGTAVETICPLVLYETPRKGDTMDGFCLTEECLVPEFTDIFVINLLNTQLFCLETCEGIPKEFGCDEYVLTPPGGCASILIARPKYIPCKCVDSFWPTRDTIEPGPCDDTCDSSSMFDIAMSNGHSHPYPHCTQGCETTEPEDVEALVKLFLPCDAGLDDTITVTSSDQSFKGSESCNDGIKTGEKLCKAVSKAFKAPKASKGKTEKAMKSPKSPEATKVPKSAKGAKAAKAPKSAKGAKAAGKGGKPPPP